MENSKPTVILTGNTGTQELEKAMLAVNSPKVAVCTKEEYLIHNPYHKEFLLNQKNLPSSLPSKTQQKKCAKGLHTYTEIASDGQNIALVKLKCIYCGTIK
jgi:hypothetical protein